jgi:hypothetical protein
LTQESILADARFILLAGTRSQQLMMSFIRWQGGHAPILPAPLQMLERRDELSDPKMILRIGCCSKAPFLVRLLLAFDRKAPSRHCCRMAEAIIARVHGGLCKDMIATLASFQVAAYPRVVIRNGYQYKSLANSGTHSAEDVDQNHKLSSHLVLDPAWHICPNTPDTLQVCAAPAICDLVGWGKQYPWQAFALVFADGSAAYTCRVGDYEQFGGGLNPGEQAAQSGALKTTGDGRYGICWKNTFERSVLRMFDDSYFDDDVDGFLYHYYNSDNGDSHVCGRFGNGWHRRNAVYLVDIFIRRKL